MTLHTTLNYFSINEYSCSYARGLHWKGTPPARCYVHVEVKITSRRITMYWKFGFHCPTTTRYYPFACIDLWDHPENGLRRITARSLRWRPKGGSFSEVK
jgi:hypothetical protein